jgi:ATP-dependent Clp protease ATP-binding subunit ClpB
VDEIVIFHRLGMKELKKVVDIQTAILAERLKARGITLKITDKARDLLGRQGYDPVYGARPLKRVIQRMVQDPIALRMLQGELKEGQTVKVDVQGNDLVIDAQ